MSAKKTARKQTLAARIRAAANDPDAEYVVAVDLSCVLTLAKRPDNEHKGWLADAAIAWLKEIRDQGDEALLATCVDRFKVIDVIHATKKRARRRP